MEVPPAQPVPVQPLPVPPSVPLQPQVNSMPEVSSDAVQPAVSGPGYQVGASPVQPAVASPEQLADSSAQPSNNPSQHAEKTESKAKISWKNDTRERVEYTLSKLMLKLRPGTSRFRILIGAISVVGIIAVAAILLTITYSKPERIRVTNVTNRSVTISWVTTKETKGVVIYSKGEFVLPGFLAGIGATRAYDDRDVIRAGLEQGAGESADSEDGEDREDGEGDATETADVKIENPGSYYVHHVTVSGLDPQATYYFMVGDGFHFTAPTDSFANDIFTAVNGAKFKTVKELETLLLPDPAYGTVVLGDQPVEDGVVFMSPRLGSEIYPLSGVLNEDGGWYVDLSLARWTDGDIVTDFSESVDKEIIMVEAGRYGSSKEIIIPMSSDTPVRRLDLGGTDAR